MKTGRISYRIMKTILGNYCDIINIDLKLQMPSTISTDSPPSVLIIFWWQDIPLGHHYVDGARMSISRNEIIRIALDSIAPTVESYLSEFKCNTSSLIQAKTSANIQDQVAIFHELQDKLSNTHIESTTCISNPQNGEDDTVSIVIPTFNRPKKLKHCLESLQTLSYPPCEIIVVDNSPHLSGTRQVVNEFPSVRYIAEEQTGSSIARNTGVRYSKGSIIAFVDDDETVHENWLSRLISCFNDPRTGIATGLVLPSELCSEVQFIFEKRFSFIRGYIPVIFDTEYYQQHRKKGVPVWEIGGSGNMAIRRSVYEQLAGFDERLGAGRAGCNEDTELFYNALVHGWYCRYEPRAVTFHAHRMDVESLRIQLFFYMRGHVTALLMQYSKHKDIGNLWRLIVVLPIVYLKYFLRALAGDPAFRFHFLSAEIFGCFSGFRYFIRNRRNKRGNV